MFILDQLTGSGSKQDLDGTVVCHVCRYSTECPKDCVQFLYFVLGYGTEQLEKYESVSWV